MNVLSLPSASKQTINLLSKPFSPRFFAPTLSISYNSFVQTTKTSGMTKIRANKWILSTKKKWKNTAVNHFMLFSRLRLYHTKKQTDSVFQKTISIFKKPGNSKGSQLNFFVFSRCGEKFSVFLIGMS